MDLTSKRMYNTFKDELWKNLGPLDTKWFEALTAEAFAGMVSDQDELCANQEGNFKTPFEKSAVDSQMFSSPNVFRHSQTPEADNEQSLTAKEQDPLLWTAESPCQMAKERRTTAKSYAVIHSPDSFDLPPTPNKYPINFAKPISESLGAQGSDISWTSSLNTPPPLPSTLILSRKDQSSSTVTLTENKNDFVRKLFPSVSNASRNMAVSLKNSVSIDQEVAIHTEDNAELNESFQTWRQTLPDITDDVEVCSTVASGLQKAENALSIFLTNSSSVSRKVKNERVKRRQIIPLKQNGCDTVEFPPTNTVLSKDNVKEPDSASVQPTGNIGVTQWSPLSLSEIHDTFCCNKVQVESSLLTDQSFRKNNSGQKTTHLKKCNFYTVNSSKSLAKEMSCQTKTSSPSICLSRQIDKSKNCRVSEGDHVQNVENVIKEDALDIFQPSTALAKDFSQMSELVKLSTVTEDALQDGFFSSACLSALKRAKQKANVERIQREFEDISDRELVSALNLNTISDSGFQYVSTSNQLEIGMDTTSNVPLPNLENEQELIKTKVPSNPVNNFSGRICVSGFKTASNTILHISTASFDRARISLDNIKEEENDQLPLSTSEFKNGIWSKPNNSNHPALSEKESCHLTASQKADVKQLCSFLEESTSQFEFTQFRTANINGQCQNNGTASPKSDKEADPNFLDGIDFNDSFSSVTEKPFPTCEKLTPISEVQTHLEMSNCESKSSIVFKKRHSSTTKMCTSYASPSKSNEIIQECKEFKAENKCMSESAQRKVLRVSKKCLGKARALFADLELAQRMVSKNHNSDVTKKEVVVTNQNVINTSERTNFSTSFSQNGFKIASEKGIENSAKAMLKAKTFFKVCDVAHKGAEVENHVPGNIYNEIKRSECKNIQQKDDHKEYSRVDSCDTANLGNTCLPYSGNGDVIKIAKPKQLANTHLTDSILLTSQNSEFKTANDKGLLISSAALKKAKLMLDDYDQVENNTKPPYSKPLVNGQIQNTKEFLAASGKEVAISIEALLNAKSLLDDTCFTVDTPVVSSKRNNTENKGITRSGFTAIGLGNVHFSHPRIQKVRKEDVDSSEYLSVQPPERESAAKKICSGTETREESKLNQSPVSNDNLSQTESQVSFPTNKFHTSNNIKLTELPLNICKKPTVSAQSRAFFEGAISGNSTVSETRKTGETEVTNLKTIQCGFTTTRDTKVYGAKKKIEKVKHLWKDFDDAFFNDTKELHLTKRDRNVTISTAAFKKSKLLSESEDGEDKSIFTQFHNKLAIIDSAPRINGIQSTSGRPVAVSAEAQQKAMGLFDDMSFKAEYVSFSDVRETAENTETIQSDFSTAGGTKVHIAKKNIENAKSLWKDFEEESPISSSTIEQLSETSTSNHIATDGNGLSVSDEAKQLLREVQILKCDRFQTAAGRAVSISSGALNNAKRLFIEHEHEDAEDQILKVQVNDAPLRTSGFQSASGKPVAISAKALKKAKTLFGSSTAETLAVSEMRDIAENTENTQCGFTTEGGTKVHVAKKIIEKVNNLCKDLKKDCPESSSYLEHPRDSETNLAKKDLNQSTALNFISLSGKRFDSGSGFCTASGKTVKVSDEAMSKAKKLLSEDQKDTNLQLKPNLNSLLPQSNGYRTPECRRVAFSSAALNKAKQLLHKNGKVAVSEPSPGTSGFQAASGKPLAISSKALQKALALFDDIGFEAEMLAGTETRETGNTKSNATIQHCLTLPSADVARKNVKVDPFTSNLNQPVKMDMPTEGVDHSLTKETVPLIPLEFHEEKITFSEANHNESTEGKKSNVGKKHCSISSLESPNLRRCTATQQKLLAQEALDCTMALLEDEVRTAQSVAVSSENLQSNPITYSIPVEPQNRIGKRQVEDENTTDQRPPKRRLLEEFDRTLDGPKGSTLYPAKSYPNGLLKDRSVFQYIMSLHPNVTRPHGSGSHYIKSKLQKGSAPSTSAISQTGNAKTSVFVPLFLNNTRAQAQKNGTQKENKRTFVPPFKKHKMGVQEHSTTAREEDSVTSSKTNLFVLPSRKSPNTVDVNNSKGKHNIRTHTSEDSAKTEISRAGGTDKTAAERSQETGIAHCQEIIENLEKIQLARNMQDIRIWKKKNIQPLPGSLFLTKTSQVARVTLRTAVNGETPQKYTPKQLYEYGVHQQWSELSSETARSLRFNLLIFHKQEAFTEAGGVQLADGGWLIPRNDGTAGKEEFYKALCDTPGVDPKLLSEEWVYNHYRWVVWKLVSMERSFPATMGSRCLTPEQVLLQLKYRYDIEVDQSRRPALRKIMEKDDTAAKTLVLCVCGVISKGGHSPRTRQDVSANPENPWAVVVLTDGWYAIKAQLDDPLTAMLHKGQIAVGVKIMIHGAQLVGSQDPCFPLEAPESLMLKIFANSTRRVRWDTKLGFHRDPRPFLLPVSSLFSNGGPVGSVDIVVLRSYPIQWMERKPDGGVVFRSARAEEKEARRYNCHKQKTMETLYAKIEAEFENEEKGKEKSRHRRPTMRPEALARLQVGEELHEAVGNDLSYVEAFSEKQLETLSAYRRTLMDQRQAKLQERYRRALEDAETKGSCPKRDVTTVWRLCVADSLAQTGRSVHKLSIWKPSSDLESLLKEGCRYKVYNLTTSEGKKQGGSTTVQLVSTKKTKFQDLQDSQEWLSAHFHPRVCVSFAELKNPDFKPLCGEVDLTGFVISVIDEHSFSPAFYLVDISLNFVKVRSFVSFSQSGWEDIVKLRGLLALSNLQLRGQSLSPTPVLYAGDMTVLSTNPREVHLQQSLCQLRDAFQLQDDFFLAAEKRFSEIGGQHAIVSPDVYKISTKDTKQDTKTNVTCQLPVRSLGAFTPITRTPSFPTTSAEKDPKTLKRRRALDYLSQIPSPPPLSQLSTRASPCVKKTFNPPRRSRTFSTLKAVQTPAPKLAPVEEGWVNDEELAMIDTQELRAADSLLD